MQGPAEKTLDERILAIEFQLALLDRRLTDLFQGMLDMGETITKLLSSEP